MEPFSIIDTLKNVYNIVPTSTFFLICLIISVVFLIISLINIKKIKKVMNFVFTFGWLTCLALIIIKYYDYFLSILDNLMENILMSIYFPNISIFVIVLIISNILLFISLFNQKKAILYKIIWSISGIIINFLFVLILDIVVNNGIDVYTATEVYSNTDLYVLLNTSMIIITINLILSFIIYLSSKLITLREKKGNTIDNIEEKSINNSIDIGTNQVINNINDNTPINYTTSDPLYEPNYEIENNNLPLDNNINNMQSSNSISNNNFIQNTINYNDINNSQTTSYNNPSIISSSQNTNNNTNNYINNMESHNSLYNSVSKPAFPNENNKSVDEIEVLDIY